MGIESYPKVRVTTDVVVLTVADLPVNNARSLPDKGVQVMLIKRDAEPFKDEWTLPGGFVNYSTPLIETIYSKLEQKTGAKNLYVEQLYTYGDDIHRDPRDRVISVAYIALVNMTLAERLKASSGDNETEWFWVKMERDAQHNNVVDLKLKGTDSGEIVDRLGFDHKKMIIDSLNRVGNKVMYTDIGFNLVEKEFTVAELKNTFETLTGRKLPGFRRTIMPKIQEVGSTTLDVRERPDSYRPAKLYRKLEV